MRAGKGEEGVQSLMPAIPSVHVAQDTLPILPLEWHKFSLTMPLKDLRKREATHLYEALPSCAPDRHLFHHLNIPGRWLMLPLFMGKKTEAQE